MYWIHWNKLSFYPDTRIINVGSNNVGFIGLRGWESLGMTEQLANKLPGNTQLDVYDTMENSVPNI